MGLLDKLAKKAGFELGEDETYQLSISIKNGKVNCCIEAVPDIENMTLDKLYSLQELLEEQLDDLSDKEPDDDESPEYEAWDDQCSKIQEQIDQIDDRIDELTEDD